MVCAINNDKEFKVFCIKTLMNLTTKDYKRYQMVPVPPGLMQYHVKQESINNFNIDELKIKNTSFKEGFEFETHSYENLQRLIPFTTTGKKNKDDWKILLIIKRTTEEKICLKGALINTTNKEIALISSINSIYQTEYKYRLIKSFDSDYKICQCKMIAPLFFWEELKNRITN